MPSKKPVQMLCVYRPKKGKAKALEALVKKHWPALKKAGLVTDEPAQIFRASGKHGKDTYFVEIFSWKDEKASSKAHQSPEVMSIWEPMGPIIENGPSPELAVLESLRAAK